MQFGYFLLSRNCSRMTAPPVLAGGGPHAPMTPEHVRARTMWQFAQSIAWGAPLTLFWQVYSNELGAGADGARCNRGYWLVDPGGADAPVFAALKQYYAAAEAYFAAYAARRGAGARPDANEFRRWAVAKLVELAGYSDAVAPPEVRPLDLAAAAAGGGW